MNTISVTIDRHSRIWSVSSDTPSSVSRDALTTMLALFREQRRLKMCKRRGLAQILDRDGTSYEESSPVNCSPCSADLTRADWNKIFDIPVLPLCS